VLGFKPASRIFKNLLKKEKKNRHVTTSVQVGPINQIHMETLMKSLMYLSTLVINLKNNNTYM